MQRLGIIETAEGFIPTYHPTYSPCPVMKECPDTRKLRRSIEEGNIDEELAEQDIELCQPGGFNCSLKSKLLERDN